MKNKLIIAFLFSIHSIAAQPGEFFFGPGRFYDIAASADGGFYLLYSEPGSISLRKINAGAETIWNRHYPLSNVGFLEYGYRLASLDNGNLLIVGEQVEEGSFPERKGLAMMVDANGQRIWKYFYPLVEALFDAAAYEEGFLLAGKKENQGAVIWLNTYGIMNRVETFEIYNSTQVKRVFPSHDGNFLLIGRTHVTGAGFWGIFLRKVDPAGGVLWEKLEDTGFTEEYYLWGSDRYLEPLGAAQLPDGSIWVVNPDEGRGEAVLMHFSANGERLGKKYIGSPNYREYPYTLTPLPNGDWMMSGYAEKEALRSNDMGFAIRLSREGAEVWRQYYDVSEEDDRLYGHAMSAGGQFYYCGVSGENSTAWLLRAEENGNVLPWKVRGRVVIDANANCSVDPDEPYAANWFIIADNGEKRQVLQTDTLGNFLFHTDDAATRFTLAPPSPADAWIVCENEVLVISNAANPEADVAFLVQSTDPQCSWPEVSLAQPDLVRCHSSWFYATVKNRGLGATEPLVLTITPDFHYTFLSASEPHFENGADFEFEIPPLPGLSEKTIAIHMQLGCDTQLGHTHPVRADIRPLSCEPGWPGPQFRVDGRCEGDEAVFEMVNEGGGGPGASSNYRVLADDLIAVNWTTVSLPEGGAPVVLSFPADGQTWRVELEQAPGLPGDGLNSSVAADCGVGANGLYSIGYEDAFRLDGEGPSLSYVIPMNTTGVPNKVSPATHGFGYFNFIGNTAPLEFTARVENPFAEQGEEVFFILDFNPALDVSTFQPLAANKPVTTTLIGESAVRATMNDVHLDSGAVAMLRFRIHPFADTPADSAAASLFSVTGKAFINGKGPIELGAGYLNYSLSFPVEVDAFNAYPPETLRFGGRGLDFGSTMAVAEDGSVFLGGETSSYCDQEYYSGLLIKTDQDGQASWLQSIALEKGGLCTVKGIVPMPDGGCIIAGNSIPSSAETDYLSEYHPYVARVDRNGHLLWSKKYRPGGADFGAWVFGMLKAADGNAVIYGYSENGPGAFDEFFWKVNDAGETVWLNYEVVTGSAFQPHSGISLPDGSLVFVGTNNSTEINVNTYLRKISASGEDVWSSGYDNIHHFYPEDLALGADGGFMIAGYSSWVLSGRLVHTPTFIKVMENGNVEWEKNLIIEPFRTADIYSIIANPQGGFFAGGRIFADTLELFHDMLLLKIDEQADTAWVKHFGVKNSETVRDMAITDEGKMMLWGFNQRRPPAYNLQAVLTLVDTVGHQLVSHIEETGLSRRRTLIYPNPIQEVANIALSPPPVKPVLWKLLNLNGIEVSKGITNNDLFELPLKEQEAGIYFLFFLNGRYPPARLVVIK